MPRRSKKTIRCCEYFSWRLFQREGVWYADGRLAEQHLGKHSLGTRDAAEAENNLKELDRQKATERGLIKPEAILPKASADIAIADGWRQYLAFQARSEVTGGSPSISERYRSVSVRHTQYCQSRGIRGWQEIDRRHIERYGDFLHEQEFAANTQHLELTALKAVKNFLVEEGLLPESARVRISLQRSQESTTYCYRRDEVQAMLQLCQTDPDLHWLGDILLTLACTGLRISELIGLRWTDIQTDASGIPLFIRIADERGNARIQRLGTGRRTKGKRGRVIPVHQVLQKRLTVLPRATDGRIFHRPDGKALKYYFLHDPFKDRVVEVLADQFSAPEGEVGFSDSCFHSFRHYFVSQAFIGGATEGAIREWVGHSDSRVVERYRHLATADSIRKMEQLNLVEEVTGPGSSGPDLAARKGETRTVSTRRRKRPSEKAVT